MKHKRFVSTLLTFVLCVLPIVQPMTVNAESTTDVYPYTLFAASEEDGAITANASNFCVNGNVLTNGSIVASGNFNVNGTKTEYAGESMIYVSGKLRPNIFQEIMLMKFWMITL